MSMNRQRRRQRAGGKRTGLLVAVLVVCVSAAGVANYLRPLPAIAVSRTVISGSAVKVSPLAWPGAGEAAIGAQGFGLLAEGGQNAPLPVASIAKIITAMAILEQKPLAPGQQGPGLTISANDVAIYQKYAGEDGSVVPVVTGEQLTEYEMLQAMLLPSANNVADSAAIWTFGSLPNYVTYANQMLQQLGLTHTIVSDDASGFLPHTTSTASDLVRLGQIALQNPVLAQIVAQPQADLPVVGTVHNVDALLGTAGIVGIKTGNTDQAGGCFLFAATYTPASNHAITIVGAVMGTPDLGAALQASLPLLASARQNFQVQTFAQAGQVIASYKAPWGGTAQVVAPEDVSAVVWSGTPVEPTVSLLSAASAITKNQRVGTMTVHAGNSSSSHTLVTTAAIPPPSWHWRLFRNPF